MFTLDTIVAPHPHVVGQMFANEAVLLLPSNGEVKVLNDVGTRIWALLDGQRTVRQIAALVCAEYQVEQAQAEHDTQRFVADLLQRNMVVLAA